MPFPETPRLPPNPDEEDETFPQGPELYGTILVVYRSPNLNHPIGGILKS